MFAALVLLFIINLNYKLFRSNSVTAIIRNKYSNEVVKLFRQSESCSKRYYKTKEDLLFLQTCRCNNIFPNFIYFKLYKRSLYKTDFYKSMLQNLLDHEITSKETNLKKLDLKLQNLFADLRRMVSRIDFLCLKKVISFNLKKFLNDIKMVHNKKLSRLNISPSKFCDHDSYF